MGASKAIVSRIKTSVVARFYLALENLALRQQIEVLERSGKRPNLRPRDRLFWVLLSALWPDWRSSLVIVKVDYGTASTQNLLSSLPPGAVRVAIALIRDRVVVVAG